ncbi:MAG: 50S ribosomal protein L28, partial [Planctomycetia bacterium]
SSWHDEVLMGLECEVCHKSVSFGRSYEYRGKAKYLGGIGKKITGITKRKFKPNIQNVRAMVKGSITRLRVCTQCIRSGKVQRPVVHKPFSIKY